MVRYRRNFLAGGTYFFTLTLHDRVSQILVEHIDVLREAFRAARQRHPFTIDAIVVLPEHLHVVMTLPPDDARYDSRICFVKGRFSRRLAQLGTAIHRVLMAPSDQRGELTVNGIKPVDGVRVLRLLNAPVAERTGGNVNAPFAGGMAPIIAATLVQAFPGHYWPLALYLIVLAVISLVCVLLLAETSRKDIRG